MGHSTGGAEKFCGGKKRVPKLKQRASRNDARGTEKKKKMEPLNGHGGGGEGPRKILIRPAEGKDETGGKKGCPGRPLRVAFTTRRRLDWSFTGGPQESRKKTSNGWNRVRGKREKEKEKDDQPTQTERESNRELRGKKKQRERAAKKKMAPYQKKNCKSFHHKDRTYWYRSTGRRPGTGGGKLRREGKVPPH